EPSLIDPTAVNNRLTRTVLSPNGLQPRDEDYAHDAHGNMTGMPQLQEVAWDLQDRMVTSRRQAVDADDADGTAHQGERTFYTYDADGQRVRKVTERDGVRVKERSYLGSFERYREFDGSGTTVTLERETLHLIDGKQRIASIDSRTVGSEANVPQQVIR